MLKLFTDLFRIGQRFGFARRDQGGGEHGFAQFIQQIKCYRATRYANTDGPAFGMHEPTGNLPSGPQHKGIRSRSAGFQQAVDRGVEARIHGRLLDVAAHQGERMPAFQLPDARHAFHGGLVADLTAQRVSGIRGIHDHLSASYDICGLPDEALLRGFGMDAEYLTHNGSVRFKKTTMH